MTELNELFKCNVCGNIVEIVNGGFGQLVCCSVPMSKVEAKNNDDILGEKHIPVLKKDEEGKHFIRIGETEHPMTKEHHIMFIEAISKDNKYLKRIFLEPEEKPELYPECTCNHFNARELCNLHGLYESELNKE